MVFTAWSYPARISILADSPSSALHLSGASDAKLCSAKAGSMQWCYLIAHLHAYFRQWSFSCFQKLVTLLLRNIFYLLATVNTFFFFPSSYDILNLPTGLYKTRKQHLKWSWRNDDLLILQTKHDAPNMQVIAHGNKLHISKYCISPLFTQYKSLIFAVLCSPIVQLLALGDVLVPSALDLPIGFRSSRSVTPSI